jgi:diguanylate cyclase (GGDEF)-like protein/putative nucleotidyltransferase with HDIG domain
MRSFLGGLGRAGVEVGLMGRALAGLFCAGASLALLTVVLPHSSRANVAGLLIIVGIAYVVAALLAWRARALSVPALQVALALGSTLITAVAYFSGQSPSPLVFFYLWIFLYSAYFFSRRQAGIQIAYVGVAYAVLLIAAPPQTAGPAWWVVEMGTLLVAAVLIALMRARSEQLIGQLYEAARTDPLTGLLNRRGFRELLDLELERARRSLSSMTLVVGDIDHFKEVNDRLGHPVGDDVLRRVAAILEQGMRRIDGVARVGGEEFGLVLSDIDATDAFVIVERLRCLVADAFRSETVPITLSFGIASYPEHGETAGSLLRASDGSLYTAKQAGRDRTVIHTGVEHSLPQQSRDVEAERFVAVLIDLAEASDLRFSGSARHSETVGRYAEMIARELELPAAHVGRVRLAGLLHDIGKIAIPDAILKKPGRLTDEEFAVIRQHPHLGAQILQHPDLRDIQAWVATHHERPDGRGYPHGISGAQLSLEAQILAVADAYEAMTSDRAYRSSIGPIAARAELKRGVDSQFDARIVDAFLAVLDREAHRGRIVLAHPLDEPSTSRPDSRLVGESQEKVPIRNGPAG